MQIGDLVTVGQTVAMVEGLPVRAKIDGVVRGLLAAAPEILSGGRPRLLECSMTNRDAGQDGMVCGGVIRVLLDPILG